jgi:hypothetical protein
MGWIRGLVAQVKSRLGLASPPADVGGWTFETSGPIDALLRGVFGTSWLDGGPVSREEALLLGVVERGRDLVCSPATLPLLTYRGLDVLSNAFLEQPDPDVPTVVVMAQTFEDLLFDGIAWWQKTSLTDRGFPRTARRVDPRSVSLNPPADADGRSLAPLPSGYDPRGSVVYVDGKPVPASLMIRFDSPGRPLLTAGARTVRRALLLDALAAMYAENPRPLETFTDTDNATIEPYTDSEVEHFLAVYMMGRRRGGPAWIPKQVTRTDVAAPSPADLQLVELKREVSLELALHMGLDPEDVGVNTTSRTYFNATDRRSDKINMTLAPYMLGVTDRLSMGDVTPRGQRVRHDLTEWLRPDPAAQVAYWQGMVGMGAMSIGEVRQAAGLSGQPPAAAPAPVLAATIPASMAPALVARRPLQLPVGSFAADTHAGMRFSVSEFAGSRPAPTVDPEKRTITGLALPYGARAEKFGVGFRFKPGALEYDATQLNRVRVMDGHHTYVGVHQGVQDSKAGPVVTLKILEGPPGSPTAHHRDQLLMDAAGGLADGLSVGVNFSLDPADGDAVWDEATSTYDVVRAQWLETSVTPDPAFSGARVTSVVATRNGGNPMMCQHCYQPHPQGMACQTWAQLNPAPAQQYAHQVAAPGQPSPWVIPGQLAAAPAAAPAQQQYAAPAPAGPQAAAALPAGPTSADALTAALTAHVEGMLQAGQTATAPPTAEFAQPVNGASMPLPGQRPAGSVFVSEPEPYRLTFDRKGNALMARGTHDLSQDYYQAFTNKDQAAHDRALAFVQRRMAHMFNVATTDVDELNPSRQRPDMYVDQREYASPIWSAINKGTLGDITPFIFPKFNTSSGLVAAHTEGTEPTTGALTTTSQTVTPTAYSGKARINREVWDQGGNPQVSTLIWNQMVRGVAEALEAAAVTMLNAGSFTALNTFTAGAVDRAAAGLTLGAEIETGIARLQFVRGGYRFSDGFAQADLYEALARARTTAGDPIYPMLGPANRNGQSAPRFGSIEVGGQEFLPAWALAATGQTAATKSYLVDRVAVHGWASAPQRLTMDQIAVAYVDLGVWGYQATAISDTAGVRTISWDPVA